MGCEGGKASEVACVLVRGHVVQNVGLEFALSVDEVCEAGNRVHERAFDVRLPPAKRHVTHSCDAQHIEAVVHEPDTDGESTSLGDGGVYESTLDICDVFLAVLVRRVPELMVVEGLLLVVRNSVRDGLCCPSGGSRSVGSSRQRPSRSFEASVTSGVLVTEGRGSEALEGFGTSVPASWKVLETPTKAVLCRTRGGLLKTVLSHIIFSTAS